MSNQNYTPRSADPQHNRILSDKRLNDKGRAVLAVLLSSEDGRWEGSQSELATESGLSVSSVRGVVKWLENAKFVDVFDNENGRCYRVLGLAQREPTGTSGDTPPYGGGYPNMDSRHVSHANSADAEWVKKWTPEGIEEVRAYLKEKETRKEFGRYGRSNLIAAVMERRGLVKDQDGRIRYAEQERETVQVSEWRDAEGQSIPVKVYADEFPGMGNLEREGNGE